MSNPFRYGILGTGSIARKFAAQLAEARGCVLAAVASRSSDKAAAFAKEFGAAVSYGDYNALLADDDIDGVYISLPNGLHAEWSRNALAAGRHVLCEKPLATTAPEAEEMFASADAGGKLLVEAFMYRCQPVVRKFLEVLAAGEIGEIRIVRSNFTFCRAASDDDVRYQPDQAGGSLMDVGCYPINFCRAILGREPTACQVAAHRHETGVDDYAAGVLQFGQHAVATFTCGMTVHNDRTTFVGGSEGYAAIDTPWFSPNGQFEIVQGQERRVISAAADRGVYALEAEAFAAAARGEAPPFVTRRDSIGNMQVLDQLRRQLDCRHS